MCFSFSLRMKNESCWNLFACEYCYPRHPKTICFTVFGDIFTIKSCTVKMFSKTFLTRAKAKTNIMGNSNQMKTTKNISKIKISSKLIKHKTLTHTKSIFGTLRCESWRLCKAKRRFMSQLTHLAFNCKLSYLY